MVDVYCGLYADLFPSGDRNPIYSQIFLTKGLTFLAPYVMMGKLKNAGVAQW
jgi:hypothetical protein